jgi:hypothetical protein
MPDDDVIISAEFLPEDTGDGTILYDQRGRGDSARLYRISKRRRMQATDIFGSLCRRRLPLKEGTLRINGMPYHTYYQMGEENATVTAEFERVYTIVL